MDEIGNKEKCRYFSTDDEAKDYLIQYSPGFYQQYLNNPETCVKRVGDRWMIITDKVRVNLSFGNRGYFSIPQVYTLMDTTSMDSSGITAVQNQPVLNLTGEGVIIGAVDTGIDIYNEVFRDSAGYTRIAAIWDQTLNESEPPQGYSYGTFFGREEINRQIQEGENGGERYNIVPSTDAGGHGTFTMGVAAGSRIGGEFTGAAPMSDIVMVKLRPAKDYLRQFYFVPEGVEVYSEADIMQGVDFLVEYAKQAGKPLVVMLGMGCNLGPHSGLTPLEDYLNEVAGKLHVAVCVCTGNEANAGLHYEGIYAGPEYDTVEFSIGEGQNGLVMELWNRGTETFSVGVVSPIGEIVAEVPAKLGQSVVYNFIFERTRLYLDYKVVEVVSGEEVAIMRFESPTSGIWTLRIYNGRPGGKYNLWMSGSELVSEGTHFITPSPSITLTNPSSARDIISVGGYNHIDGSLYIDSGRGFTTSEQIKPDIVAPSVSVYGPKVGGGYTYRTGTSIGNAHAAGVCALLLQWGVIQENAYLMSTDYIKALLIRGARRNARNTYPSREWGYGELDLYGVFENLAGQR